MILFNSFAFHNCSNRLNENHFTMQKPIKRTLWGVGSLVALVFIFIAWYGINAKSEVKKMNPTATGQLTDSIYSIKDAFVNMYLIKSGDRYIAIDAGNSLAGIKAGLVKLAIDPDNVVAILLTHTDGDHVNGLSLFPKATIYLSKQEEQMINGKKSRFAFFHNSLSGRAYTTIEDNQTLTILSFSIRGILAPGHSPGSMCYLVNDKYLFTGDAQGLKNGKIDRFSRFFNMDSETAAKSMERLTDFPNAQYIFTAHHGFSREYKYAVSNWGE